jgi:DNA topoisomerase VI subunit A
MVVFSFSEKTLLHVVGLTDDDPRGWKINLKYSCV